MRQRYLADLRAGDVVDDVFVVTNAQFAASSNGKHYIKAFISDRTAQVTARLWNATRERFHAMPDNAFARVRGRVENYQNNLQLIIEDFGRPVPGSFEVADLMPATARDVDEMCQRVFKILGSITHPDTRAIIQAFLDDEDLMNNFARAPAASSFHHAFVGGLLEHTLNLLEIADRLIPLYPHLSRDLCLAGVFLHDLGKTWELSYEAAFSYTDAGQLVGHIVKGAMMIEDKARVASTNLGRPIPRELVDMLQHIVLSHHEKLEHGSPKPPSTPEAVFVALVDNLDAKVSMALAATRGPGPAGEAGNWTEFLKPFGYRMYRGDPTSSVAKSDLVSPPADGRGPVQSDQAKANDGPGSPMRSGPAPRREPPPRTRDDAPPASGTPATSPPPLTGKPKISNPLFESFDPQKKR